MPQVVMKPLPWFKINSQVRKVFDEADLRRLGESLKQKQLQPVLAQPDGTLIAGERRYRAANLVGLEALEVKIADETLSDSQIKVWQLTENMLRTDLSGFEKWTGCYELMLCNPSWQMKDLADALHLDPSSVTRLLSPSRCSEAWQNALRDGKVGVSDCYAASKLGSPQEQNSLLALKLSGASRDEIEQAGRKSRNGKPPSEEKASRIKCLVPGKGATVQIVGESSMSLEEMIDAAQEWIKRAKRACENGWDCRTLERACKDEAKKG